MRVKTQTKTKTKTKIPLEKDIQLACCQYLELKRRFFWRQNTAPTFDTTRQVFRAMPKYALKGVPDIIVVTDGGYVVFLEIKRPGGRQSTEQKEFEARCKKLGAEYYVITDVAQLKEIGL